MYSRACDYIHFTLVDMFHEQIDFFALASRIYSADVNHCLHN